jgi:hypothetical protein
MRKSHEALSVDHHQEHRLHGEIKEQCNAAAAVNKR